MWYHPSGRRTNRLTPYVAAGGSTSPRVTGGQLCADSGSDPRYLPDKAIDLVEVDSSVQIPVHILGARFGSSDLSAGTSCRRNRGLPVVAERTANLRRGAACDGALATSACRRS